MTLTGDTQYINDVLEGTSSYIGSVPLSTLTTQDYISSDVTDTDLLNMNIGQDQLGVLDRSYLMQLLVDYGIPFDPQSSDAELITLIIANMTIPMRRSIFYLLPYDSISYFPGYYHSYYPSYYPGYPVGVKPYLWMRKKDSYGQRYYPGIYSTYHPYYWYRRGINPYDIARKKGFFFDPTRRIKGARNVRGQRFPTRTFESKEFASHLESIPENQRESINKFLSRRQSFGSVPRIETKRPHRITSPRTDIKPTLTKSAKIARPPISPRSMYIPSRTIGMSSSVPRIVPRAGRVSFQLPSSSPRTPRTPSSPRASSPRTPRASSPRTLSAGRSGKR